MAESPGSRRPPDAHSPIVVKSPELPTIEGERVRLRWLRDDAADLDALFELFSDPEVTRYWSWPAYTRRDQAVDLLADVRRLFAEHKLYQWGVARRSDDRVIGTATLAWLDEKNRRCEIGFALNRSCWGGGWMSEAVGALIGYAFETMGLHRLEADVDPRNAGSLRLLERAGFVREGLMRERWIVDGETADTAFYGLLAREWRARGRAPAGD